MKKLIALIAAFAVALAALPALAGAEGIQVEDYFSKRDLSGAWSNAKELALTGDVNITEAGTYLLRGEMNGCVAVNVGDGDKVQLVLDGVTLAPAAGAAILVENADKVFVTLAAGSVNTLRCAAFDGASDVDAAVFSRDDITFNGEGALVIDSAGHGIVGKDDVKIASGSYTITAEGRGVVGNDSVRIAGGSLDIVSGKDGIRAKNQEDEAKGYVVILGGTVNITAGGGAANAPARTGSTQGGMGRGGWGNWDARTASESESSDTKGVKTTGSLTVAGGTVRIDAADDGLHANTSIAVLGGSVTVSAGDDGLHADADLLIAGGTVRVERSYEGIEGMTVTVSGGDVTVYASDDGLNASGGSDGSGFGWNDMFASQEGVEIRISGGSLYVNAQGDGIDSNGDLTVTGGSVVVSGPTDSMNGALDKNGSGVITGGTVIAAGAAGMAESFDAASTQAFAVVRLNGGAGEVTVTDQSGGVILAGTVEKSFQCVVISSPALVSGQAYTVSCGGVSAEFTAGTDGGQAQTPGSGAPQPGGRGRWR